jgi:hypothetical protein
MSKFPAVARNQKLASGQHVALKNQNKEPAAVAAAAGVKYQTPRMAKLPAVNIAAGRAKRMRQPDQQSWTIG